MSDLECGMCGNSDHLASPESAKKVYDTNSWKGKVGMMKVANAEVVCAWCRSIRINGEWARMQTLQSRKQELAGRGSNKSYQELEVSLTVGNTEEETREEGQSGLNRH